MTKEQIDILLDKYVNNTLSAKEEIQFNEILDNIPELKRDLKIRQDIAQSMNYLGNKELKNLLDKIHLEEFGNEQVDLTPKSKNWIIYLIGGIILLGILGVFLLNTNTQSAESQSPENLYAEYFEPFVPSSQTRGENAEKILETFYEAYQDKNYAKALNVIKPILNEQENQVLLLASISAIQSDNHNLAQKLLDQILDSKDYYFTDHANWYKALSFLKQEKNKEAKDLLEELSQDSDADHHLEAKKLMEKI